MTTRAGLAGILTGLITSILVIAFILMWPNAFLQGLPSGYARPVVIVLIISLMIVGGAMAVKWRGSSHPWRCAALGALAGGLAGTILFCLWGAAMAGSARWTGLTTSPVETYSSIVFQTRLTFLVLFLGGSGLGAFGGWLVWLRRPKRADIFDKEEPQMAMNAAITAVPATIVASALAAGILTRLSVLFGSEIVFDRSIAGLPLDVSLLLVFISHFALTLVIPHEAQQAEHRCGMDEVRMAAYVGIGAAPLLVLLLLLADVAAFANPLVLAFLLACTSLSLISLHTLRRRILPGRAAFPTPQDDQQKAEARLFGTIATSRGPRLVVLCVGCGLAMILPMQVLVFSVLINLNHALDGTAFSQPILEVPWSLYLTQAAVSIGVVGAAIVLLILVYLFYLNLGRWFSKGNSPQ